jgi:hypothetical protein
MAELAGRGEATGGGKGGVDGGGSTVTAWQCGQTSGFPAALAGAVNSRPQPEQGK